MDKILKYTASVAWTSLPAELPQADINFQRCKRPLKTFSSGNGTM